MPENDTPKKAYDFPAIAKEAETKILDLFPAVGNITQPREIQVSAMKLILEAVASGEKRIVICGPPGIGKSILGIWAEIAFRAKATYTSPLNVLVDQLDGNFAGIGVFTLKGREHYPCVASRKAGIKATCAEAPCKHHQCIVTVDSVPIYKSRDCGNCKQREDCACNGCEYKDAVHQYEKARLGNTNFTLHQLGVFREDARVFVVDECELAKDFIRMFRGITIPDAWNPKASWETHLAILLEQLEEGRDRLKVLIKKQNALDVLDKVLAKEIEDLEDDIRKLEYIVNDYGENKEPWVAILKEKKEKGKVVSNSIRFEPITVQRFYEKMFKPDDLVFFMSATPDQEPDIELDCPFPKENRPWVYYPVGKMSWQHRQQTIPKVADFLVRLDKVRSGKKIVHCASYELARAVALELDAYNAKKTGHTVFFSLQTSSNTPKDSEGIEEVSRSRAVSNFKSSGNKNHILLSVNMWSGVDLAEDEFNTNIFMKIPFVNPDDPIYQAELKYMEDAERYMNQSIANKIMQGYGRVNRNSTKQSLTIIIDESWGWWYRKNKKLFRNYFTEAEVKKINVLAAE